MGLGQDSGPKPHFESYLELDSIYFDIYNNDLFDPFIKKIFFLSWPNFKIDKFLNFL